MLDIDRSNVSINILKNGIDYESGDYYVRINNNVVDNTIPFDIIFENDIYITIGLTSSYFPTDDFYTLQIILDDNIQYEEQYYVRDSSTTTAIDTSLNNLFFTDREVGPTNSYGPTGPQGFQGSTGPQGFQGFQGSTGPQGFQGFQGPTGPQGNQGFQGSTGPQGFQGSTGPQGNQGFQGSTGPQGFQGFQGPTGPQGNQGFQGSTGPQGFQGFQGSTGPQGFQGFQGSTGPQGFQGFQGFQGSTGPQGNQGFQGSTGPQGFQGFQGSTGPQGNQGFQGSTGPQGFQGPTGTNDNSLYKTIISCGGSITAGQTSASYSIPYGDALIRAGQGTLYPPAMVYLRNSEYPSVNGVSTKLNIIVTISFNDVAPSCAFNYGLYQVTRPTTSGGAGVLIYNPGTLVTGSLGTVSNGGTFSADTNVTSLTGNFDFPAGDNYYFIVVRPSATLATSSHVHISAQLRYKN